MKKVVELKQLEDVRKEEFCYEVTRLKNCVSYDIGGILSKKEVQQLTCKANTEVIIEGSRRVNSGQSGI